MRRLLALMMSAAMFFSPLQLNNAFAEEEVLTEESALETTAEFPEEELNIEPEEASTEDGPAEEAILPLEVRVHGGEVDAQGNAFLTASASGAEDSVQYIWQRIDADAASANSEAVCEALYETIGEGGTLTLTGLTAESAEEYLYRCVAVDGERLAVSKTIALQCTQDLSVVEETPMEEPTEEETTLETPAPEETVAPVAQSIALDAEEYPLLRATVQPEGTQVTYRWQMQVDGAWTDVADGNADTLDCRLLTADAVRCVAVAGEIMLVSEAYALPVVTIESSVSTSELQNDAVVKNAAAADAEVTAEETKEEIKRVVLNLGNQTEITMAVGQTVSTVAAVFEDTEKGVSTFSGITWSSDATDVAKVDSAKGTVTALKVGKAVITATYKSGSDSYSRSYAVNVVSGKNNLPDNVALKVSDNVLGVGETAALSVTFAAGKSDSYALATSDKSVVMLMNGDSVVALKPGMATISVVTLNGKKASVTITVKQAPTSIELNKGDFKLAVGDTTTLTADIGSAEGKVTFESDDDDVARVSADGKVEAISVGTANIEAVAYNGVSAKVSVDVTNEISTLVVEAPRTTIGVGEKVQMGVVANNDADTALTPTWSVNNTKYATISASGVLTAKARGKVTVTAKAYNGTSSSCTINIGYAPKSVSMSLPATTIGVGDSVNAKVSLSSGTYGAWEIITKAKAGNDVITIDGAKITAVNPGEIYVRAKTFNNKYSAILTIKVVAAPTSLSFEKETLNIAEGDSYKTVTAMNKGAVGSVSYTSKEPGIARVDASGKVYAVSQGSTQITATTYNGISATCDVTVSAPIKKLEAVVPATSLGVGEKVRIQAKTDTEADATLVYSVTSGDKYVKVAADGTVTAKKAGSATVKITAYNGVSTSVKFKVAKAPSKVTVSVPSTKIGLNDTMQMKVSLPSGTAGSYTYKSTNEEVATVDDNGVIHANKTGTSTVGAVAYNGKYGKVSITVVAEPTAVKFASESLTLPAGYSMSFAAHMNDGAVGTIHYESDKPEVAAINSSGKLTAVGQGEAVITATTYNGLKTTAIVKVTEAVSTVKLSLPKTTLGVGETAVLDVTTNVETDVKMTFSSSKTSVVKVDANGKITAKGKGTATITATSYNGKTGKLTVKVVAAPKTVTVKSTATTIGAGDNAQLSVSFGSGTAGSYTFKSANSDIATVDEQGVVHALKPGDAVVGAVAHNGKYGTVKIKVVSAPSRLTFDRGESCKIPAGDTVTIAARLNEGTAGTIKYESTNPEIAKVDGNGKVTALQAGWATIKAVTYNGITASYSLGVTEAITDVTLTAPVLTLGKGEKVQTEIKYSAYEDLVTSITYDTSNKNVITVSASGLVTAVGAGTAKVTAKAYNGTTSSLNFTVKAAPSSVSISAASKKLNVGDVITVTVKLSSGSTGAYELASSDETVLQVTQDGKVKAIGNGTAKIGVRTYNGKTATVSIDVGGGLVSTQDEYDPSMSDAEKIEYVIYVAQKNLGKPYSYSPNPPSSFDCSGFVRYCFSNTGKKLASSSTTMGADNTYQKISKTSDLKRGDLVFFMTGGATKINHVGLYLGGDMFIHASSGAGKVVVTSLTSYLKTQGWACGRRIFG